MSEENKIKIHSTIEVKEATDQERTLIFIGSAEVKDRDGELVKIGGIDLKNYFKNPVVLYAHAHYSIPVGKTTKIEKIKHNGAPALKFWIKFPDEGVYEFADLVYNMAKDNFLNAVSIGFMSKQGETEWIENPGPDEIRRIFHKTELLEISVCPVPSNPDALQQAKSFSAFDKYVEFNEGEVEIKTLEELFEEEQGKQEEITLTDAVMAMLEAVNEVKELTTAIKGLTVKTVIEPKEESKKEYKKERTNLYSEESEKFWEKKEEDVDDFFV